MKITFLGRTCYIGRNDPCICRSGKKFKKCCLLTINDPNSQVKELFGRPTLCGKRSYKK